MKKILVLSIIIIISYSIASAQNGPADSLTLNQAISIALKNNLNIEIANKEIRKSRYGVDENNAGLLPSVSGKSHYIYAPENGYDPSVTNGGEYGLQLSADYTLYNGGLNHIAVDKANNSVNLSELNLDKAKSDLILDVRSVYYEIENAAREVKYQTEALNSLNDYYKYLIESKSGGNATQSDVLKTEVDLNNAKINLDEALLNLEKTKKELLNLLFLPADSRLDFKKCRNRYYSAA